MRFVFKDVPEDLPHGKHPSRVEEAYRDSTGEMVVPIYYDSAKKLSDSLLPIVKHSPECFAPACDCVKILNDPANIDRILQKDLRGLDLHGQRCEACNGHMHSHEWADMDDGGFVVACSGVKLSDGDPCPHCENPIRKCDSGHSGGWPDVVFHCSSASLHNFNIDGERL